MMAEILGPNVNWAVSLLKIYWRCFTKDNFKLSSAVVWYNPGQMLQEAHCSTAAAEIMLSSQCWWSSAAWFSEDSSAESVGDTTRLIQIQMMKTGVGWDIKQDDSIEIVLCSCSSRWEAFKPNLEKIWKLLVGEKLRNCGEMCLMFTNLPCCSIPASNFNWDWREMRTYGEILVLRNVNK